MRLAAARFFPGFSLSIKRSTAAVLDMRSTSPFCEYWQALPSRRVVRFRLILIFQPLHLGWEFPPVIRVDGNGGISLGAAVRGRRHNHR
jgi:hypothetical protein